MLDNPYNSDAETAVLSTLLCNSTERLEYNGLRPYMFSSVINQTLFETIEEFRTANLNPDVAVILNNLESKNLLDKVGGKDYLNALINNYNFDKQNFPEYVRTVCDYYKARSLLNLASNIKPKNINVGDVDDIISDFKKQLEDLQISSLGSATLHIRDQLAEAFEEIKSRREHPGLRGSSWGIKKLDEATAGKVPGELWYIGGRPSQGKSALVINSILADAKAGVPILLFSREMNYQSLVERMLAMELDIPIANIRQGILNQQQVDAIFAKMTEFKSFPIYIDVNFSSTSVSYLESVINKYKRLHEVKNVYIDYIQLLSEREEGQTAELGRFSRMFKAVANNLNICMIVVSQLNRLVELRENKRPILSDLRQSGNLEEDADLVIGIYRDEYYNKETPSKNLMELIILKARNSGTGTVTVKFDSLTNKIGEA